MSYSVTIAEVINGLSVTSSATPYTVSITEVVNDITVTPPASNTISITNTTYPVTVSYNAVVVSGGGLADNGIPIGGTTGQILSKINSTDYNTQWINVPATGLQNVVEDTTPQLGGDLDSNGNKIYATVVQPPTAGQLNVGDPTRGYIQISQGVNTDIKITPHGTGAISLDGIKWPTNNGVSGYVLSTDGAGQATWVSTGGLITSANGYALPSSDGAAKQVLKTNGAGQVTWEDEQATYVSEGQPSGAKIGEQWFNPTTQILKVYTSVGWVQLSSDDQQY
ncbi:hypothetical protein UFOVP758_15 [uncultured Caudovirales phage]|uniref:Uncharacterized protein n=1 Tax=uncultured Caudovirales phage TaxID=2100421 RepID=A0A6J7XD19_9CAUD|nr:hypothetical protein UFOVP758_15 [uncultured Caudovirales phage]